MVGPIGGCLIGIEISHLLVSFRYGYRSKPIIKTAFMPFDTFRDKFMSPFGGYSSHGSANTIPARLGTVNATGCRGNHILYC
jgi:hypothetical protein